MYTVYSCRRTKGDYFFKTSHGGICPHCGGPLDAECVCEAFYNAASE